MKKSERDTEITLAGEAAYSDAKLRGESEDEALNKLIDAEKEAAMILGRKGGSVKSDKKSASSRENGKLGGRPKSAK